MVIAAARYHFAVAVVGGYLYYIAGKADMSLVVKLHNLAVEIGAENGVFNIFQNKPPLQLDNVAYEPAALFGRIEAPACVVAPERAVALTAKAQRPDYLHILLFLNRVLPELMEKLRSFGVIRLDARVFAHKHLRAQRLGVVMCYPKSHIRREPAVYSRIFVRTRDNQISAASEQRLKNHTPRLGFVAVYLPAHYKNLVVYKPAAVFNRRHGRFILTRRHGYFICFLDFLIQPEPKRLYTQKFFAYIQKTVDEAQIVRRAHGYFIRNVYNKRFRVCFRGFENYFSALLIRRRKPLFYVAV